jgi:membrane protein
MNIDGLKQSVPGKVGQKYIEDQSPNWAVLIAWNTLFAMFPIVLFAASILGIVLRLFGQANSAVYNTIFNVVPDQHARDQLSHAVTGVKTQTGLLFIVGLLGLLWGGSALFGAMEQAFAVIYHTVQRNFIKQKLIAFGMVLLFTVLAGVAVASSAILPALKHIPGVPTFLTSGLIAAVLQIAVGILAGFILFSSIYYVIPNRRQEWGKVWPGALVAGIAFEIIALVFPLYLTFNKGINQYGAAFGLMFVLMTFFYFIGLITMLGVEVNAVLFPVPVEQPTKRGEPGRTAASAPPQTGPEGEGKMWSPKTSPRSQPEPTNVREREVRRQRLPARVPAFLIFLGSAIAGLLVGRRAAGTD